MKLLMSKNTTQFCHMVLVLLLCCISVYIIQEFVSLCVDVFPNFNGSSKSQQLQLQTFFFYRESMLTLQNIFQIPYIVIAIAFVYYYLLQLVDVFIDCGFHVGALLGISISHVMLGHFHTYVLTQLGTVYTFGALFREVVFLYTGQVFIKTGSTVIMVDRS